LKSAKKQLAVAVIYLISVDVLSVFGISQTFYVL